MAKLKLNANTYFYPMPMTLVGTADESKANFAAIAWINRVNYKPPLIMVGINKSHTTAQLVEKNKEFSVNIPNQTLVKKTDYCGITKGSEVDKSALFTIFTGELQFAPMIEECPINMECKLLQVVELPSNNLYIAEIHAAYSEKRFLTDGKPDISKIRPFTLTMPDNTYWSVGEPIGKAWSIGRELKEKK